MKRLIYSAFTEISKWIRVRKLTTTKHRFEITHIRHASTSKRIALHALRRSAGLASSYYELID